MAKPRLLNPTEVYSLKYLFVGTIETETPASITTNTVLVYNLSGGETQILNRDNIVLSYGRYSGKNKSIKLLESKRFKDVYVNEINDLLGSADLKNAVLTWEQIKKIQGMHNSRVEVAHGK